MRILEGLPESMTVKEALEEARRVKRDDDLAKDRVRVEAYRQSHMEEKRARDRAYRARKKAKLQAVTAPGKSHEALDKNVGSE